MSEHSLLSGLGAGSGYKWTVLLVTTIGVFMVSLDTSIVTIALPSIASSIHMGLEAAVWIQLAYLLLLTVLLINAGRLADLKGRKRLYTLGFFIFTISSALCGTSGTDLQLIAFRAIQGVGAALIASNSSAILTDAFPGSELGKALGVYSMAIYTGLVTGPIVGGILVQGFGWRSIFFVNVPIGIVVILLATMTLKETVRTRRGGEGFDFAGAVSLSVALAAILVLLTLAGIVGLATTLTLLLISGVSFISFLRIEAKVARYPVFELSLFTKNRLFAAANTTAFLAYVAFTGVTLMMSIFLQNVKGLNPSTTGLFLVSISLSMALLSPISGWLSDRFGSRSLSTAGMMCVTLGLYLFSELNTTSSTEEVILKLVLLGVGFGLFSSPNTSAVMGSVERSKLGVAAGTLGTMRFMGQAIGLALLGAVISTAIPPKAMLAIFTGLNAQNSVTASEFTSGMRTFFLVTAGVGGISTAISMVRGGRVSH